MPDTPRPTSPVDWEWYEYGILEERQRQRVRLDALTAADTMRRLPAMPDTLSREELDTLRAAAETFTDEPNARLVRRLLRHIDTLTAAASDYEELAAIRDRADHHYVTHDDDGPTIHAGTRLDDVRALLAHIDALTAAVRAKPLAFWSGSPESVREQILAMLGEPHDA